MDSHVELNKRLGAARSLREITAISGDTSALNLVNCCTALQKAAKLLGAPCDSGQEAELAGIADRGADCFNGGGGGGGGGKGSVIDREVTPQPRHVAAALWSCAKLRIHPSNLIDAAVQSGAAMQPGWFKPQEVSMVAWALGKLAGQEGARKRHHLPQQQEEEDGGATLLRKLLPSALSRTESFDPQGIANVISGVASVSLAHPKVPFEPCLPRLLAALTGRLSSFSPQELANSLSGLAKMGARLDSCPGLYNEVAAAVQRRLPDFTPQNLANAAWSSAKLVEKANDQEAAAHYFGFWGMFALAVTRRISELNSLELSMCAWAAAQSLPQASAGQAVAVAELTEALALAARSRVGELDAQQMATTALALAKLGPQDHRVWKVMSKAARPKMEAGEFKPQDLDNFASSYARLVKWKGPKLVTSLAKSTAQSLSDGLPFPVRNLANVMCAVAKLSTCGDRSSKVVSALASLADAAASNISINDPGLASYNLRDLANIAWGFAVMDQAQPRVMRSIGVRAAGLLDTYHAQECSKLLYAFGKSRVQCAEFEDAATAQRTLSFDFLKPVGTVSLKQSLGGTQGKIWEREETGAIAGNGGALFEDSFVMAEWMTRHGYNSLPGRKRKAGCESRDDAVSSWHGVSAVELGAGLGLCAVVAQRLGIKMTATDGDASVLEQLQANAQENSGDAGGSFKAKRLKSKLLKWGEDDPMNAIGLKSPPDIIIATGCVYGSDLGVWKALATTLKDLSGTETIAILAHGTGAAPGVHHLRGDFYGLAEEHWEISRAPQHTIHPEHQGCQIHFLKRRSNEEESMGVCEKGSRKSNQGKRKRGDAEAVGDGHGTEDDVSKVDAGGNACSTAEEGREKKKKKEKEKKEKKEKARCG